MRLGLRNINIFSLQPGVYGRGFLTTLSLRGRDGRMDPSHQALNHRLRIHPKS